MLGALRDNQVQSFVEEQGAHYKELSPAERSLLQNPYTLFLWWELYREGREIPRFLNKANLLSEYRGHLVRRLSEMGQAEAPVLLDELVQYLDRNGRLDAPSILVGTRTEAQEALQSLNVLRKPRHGFLTFAHQSLLDFLIAERVAQEALREGSSPADWLRRNDQSLFRRDQLRQLLTLLRDSDPALYIATLEEILTAQDIRFHLQHLALGILREPANPGEDDLRLVKRLLDIEEWQPHVLTQVLFGSRVWFERLDDDGIFAQWLASNDDRLIEGALQACRSVASQVPDRIERLLGPHWYAGDETWREKIDSALGYEVDQFTEHMADWRRARVREGSRRIDWFDLDDLADRHPIRAVMLLEAHLLNMLDRLKSTGKLTFDWRDRTRGTLEKACRAVPEEAWVRLLPILMQSIRLFKEARSAAGCDFARLLDSDLRGLQKINYNVRTLLSEAGAELAHREGLAVADRIAPLFAMKSRSMQRLVLYLLLKGPDELADLALQWLYADSRRFQPGSFRDASRFEPARCLIERFAGLCSSEVYEELEARLMAFHPESEVRAARCQREVFRPRGPLRSSEIGRAQHILLSALPRGRMSRTAHHRLQAWERKFGEPLKGRLPRGEGGVIRSPIPQDKLRLASDKQWLSIIAKDWAERHRFAPRRDFLVEVSHELFARDFGVAARLEPERFIRLALRVPPSAPSDYFSALLRAFGDKPPGPDEVDSADWQPAPIDGIEKVLKHIEGLLKCRNIAWGVCRLAQARAAESWPDWVLDLLRAYTESEPEPSDSLALETEGEGDSTDIDMAVEDSMRCVAAETLMMLLFERRDLAAIFLPTIERLVKDPSAEMRVAAQGLCLPLFNVDRKRAVRLFLQSCDHPDSRVLAGMYTNRFLKYTWHWYPEDLTPLLGRMIESDNENVAETGAFWTTVGQIGEGLYGELAERCLVGSKILRKGAAEALAQLLRWPEAKQRALRGLQDLLQDGTGAADIAVASLLRRAEILGSPQGPILAEAFIRSSAMEHDPGDLFYGLRNFNGSLEPYAPVLREAVQRLGGDLAPATRDHSQRLSGAVMFLPEVLLRLYEQAEGPELRQVRHMCLDAWDSLLRGQVGLSWDVLRKLDV